MERTDHLDKRQRSYCMSRIKSKWTSPEIVLHNLLKSNKIKHKMHPNIVGSPDITLKDRKIAIYIHGCFWHGCKRCYRKPVNNKGFWEEKLKNNIERDKRNIKKIKNLGWIALVFWEHEIKSNKEKVSSKITHFL